jgi:hypothetical protein
MKIFKMFSLVKQLLSLPKVTIRIFGDAKAREAFEYFTQPHSRYRIIQHKRWGVALLELPDTFESYIAGGSRELVRRKRKAAEKAGFSVGTINPLDHLDEILEINQSMPVRGGNKIRDDYVDRDELRSYFEQTGEIYGVWSREKKVRAYAFMPVFGEVFHFSRLMGHGDDLEKGIMFLLITTVIRDMIASKAQHGHPLWGMYDMYFGADQGMRFFKDRLGFKPQKVTWVWVDKPQPSDNR